jgi:endonuclease/exonuclease/phosphatase family metal-dependent hydrolase
VPTSWGCRRSTGTCRCAAVGSTRRGGWGSAWATAGSGPGLTFDAATPHARIDYILISPDVAARAAWLVPTAASDHYPVVVDLAI